jgi:hypothetical protein
MPSKALIYIPLTLSLSKGEFYFYSSKIKSIYPNLP